MYRFFSKPMAYKETVMRQYWKPENSNVLRGYYPIIPGMVSRKEAFEFGRDPMPDDPDNTPGNW